MEYKKSEFILFPQDSGRVIANLEAAYEQWLDARQQIIRMPVSTYWTTVGGRLPSIDPSTSPPLSDDLLRGSSGGS